jgi:hypothetical protein
MVGYWEVRERGLWGISTEKLITELR